MTTLCVPTYSRYHLCRRMLASAAAGTVTPDQYVVIDNGGEFETDGRPSPNLRIIRPGRNLGVAASWNWFMRNVGGTLLVCNDDVVLDDDLLETLLAAKSHHPNALLLHPAAAGPGDMSMFSVFLLDPRAMEVVGLFDEAFHPAYFEDKDYLYRMRLLGLSPLSVPGAGYHHRVSATIKAIPPDQLPSHHRNFEVLRQHYIAKWGGEPGEERFTSPFNGPSRPPAMGAAQPV
jgi:GT2 family glycosyltransferase